MSREPFSAGSSDDTTGSGPTSYTGNPVVRTPALGRSSRDIAADVGPGGATEGAFSPAPGAGELFTGDDNPDVNPDAAVGRRRPPGSDVPRHPEIDPDTRLGLHPTISAGQVPSGLQENAFEADPPATRAITGFSAGIAGAVPVVMISYAAFWINSSAVPSFIAANRALIGTHSTLTDHLLGLIAGFISAGIWGIFFGLLVGRPTIAKGVAFGFVPTLFTWLVVAPLTGRHLFMGFQPGQMLFPLVLNMLVWGPIVGHLCGRWLRPASV